MLFLDYLLAVALLTAPAASERTQLDGMFSGLRLPLQSLAVQLEILDPREVRYILARAEDFEADLALLRRRYQELATAPPIDDALRFPERAMVTEFLAFNRSYRQAFGHPPTRDRISLRK